MKNKLLAITILLILSSLFFTGCISVNRQFSEVKDKIMGKLSEDYKTEYQFSVGPTLINISSWFVNLSDDQEYFDDMMREISSVQVGIYNKVKNENTPPDFNTLQQIDNEMKNKGWKYIVRSIEDEEMSLIYLSAKPEKMLKTMYVVNMNDDELIIIEVNGNLKKVIEYAIEEKNLDVEI